MDTVEAAVHLVRSAPAPALASYCVGTFPFVLAFLFFWGEMSRSAFAHQTLAGGALGLAGLFGWMKFWQAVYARQLLARLALRPAPTLPVRGVLRVLFVQTALQSTGLFLVPLAAALAIPYAWVYAFYQNLTALGHDPDLSSRELTRRAVRFSGLWAAQNHGIVLAMTLFAVLVLLNWASACLLVPAAAKMLFGLESVFTRGTEAMINSTFFAAVLALTYVTIDPIMKAIYVLRCFHAESLHSGEDLKAGLRSVSDGPGFAARTGPALVALALIAAACSAVAAPPEPAKAGSHELAGPAAAAGLRPAGVAPTELDDSIREVLGKRKYAWRLPRETPDAQQKGILTRFAERCLEVLKKGAAWFQKTLESIFRRLFRRPLTFNFSTGTGWMDSLRLLLYVLLAAVVLALVYLLYRNWRWRRLGNPVLAATPMPAVDVADDNVGADHLPEDGWLALARELLAKGDLRLALRALYLASLANLAQRGLISLARFKSNLEYERELRRRERAFPGLLEVFGENLAVFERSWYGMHEVDDSLVARFAGNVEKIKTVAGGGTGPPRAGPAELGTAPLPSGGTA